MTANDLERPRHGPAMHWRIAAGLFLGFAAGLLARAVLGPSKELEWIAKNLAEPVGQIFLRMILMVVIPLVFSSLVLGIAGIGDPRRLGKIGLRTFLITLIFSVLSVVIGITIANIVRPGDSLGEEQQAAIAAKFQGDAAAKVENAKKAKRSEILCWTLFRRTPCKKWSEPWTAVLPATEFCP